MPPEHMESNSRALLVPRHDVKADGYTPRNPSNRRRILNRYWDSWWPETAALSLGISCTITVAGVLGQYDNSPSPKISLGITLNAIISILATTSKADLIYVVSNCLGQLKWVWFSSSHALSDAEQLDCASRGPLGATNLLRSPTRNLYASLGALIIVLALTIDPFVQQIITYENEDRYYSSPAASIKRAHRLNYTATAATTARGFGSAFINNEITLDPQCGASSCIWPSFQTYGFCGECTKDTSWVLSDECNLNWTTAESKTTLLHDCKASRFDGRSIEFNIILEEESYHIKFPTYQISLLGGFSEKFCPNVSDISNSFRNVSEMSSASMFEIGVFDLNLEPNMSLTLRGENCKLDLCNRNYQLSVLNGTTHALYTGDHLRKTFPMLSYVLGDFKFQASNLCFEPPYTVPVNFSEYPVVLNEEGYVLQHIPEEVPGFCLYARVGGLSTSDHFLTDYCPWSTSLGQVIGNIVQSKQFYIDQSDSNISLSNPNGFDSYMDFNQSSAAYMDIWYERGPNTIIKNLADSLTNMIMDPELNHNGTREVNGSIIETVSFVRVRWKWLALPCCLNVGGLVLLLVMILRSRRVNAPLWKSSINALFYHGLDHDIGLSSSLATISEMDRQASLTRARLAPLGRDRRLLLETRITKEN